MLCTFHDKTVIPSERVFKYICIYIDEAKAPIKLRAHIKSEKYFNKFLLEIILPQCKQLVAALSSRGALAGSKLLKC